MTARLRDVERGINVLRGTVAGLIADDVINDREIAALSDWLGIHANLLDQEPFREIAALLERILSDGKVDEDERAELLEWCQDFSDPCSGLAHTTETDVMQLHGFLQGLAADDAIEASELGGLNDWLHEHRHLDGYWPYSEIWGALKKVLHDRKVSTTEKARLLEYCMQFTEHAVDPQVARDRADAASRPYMCCDAPTLASISMVCEQEPNIVFSGRTFCFTGQALAGKRGVLQDMARAQGGVVRSKVTRELDYLVVGALSQPAWKYSVYGRKIEAVMLNRQQGGATTIIWERDFLEAIERQAAKRTASLS